MKVSYNNKPSVSRLGVVARGAAAGSCCFCWTATLLFRVTIPSSYADLFLNILIFWFQTTMFSKFFNTQYFDSIQNCSTTSLEPTLHFVPFNGQESLNFSLIHLFFRAFLLSFFLNLTFPTSHPPHIHLSCFPLTHFLYRKVYQHVCESIKCFSWPQAWSSARLVETSTTSWNTFRANVWSLTFFMCWLFWSLTRMTTTCCVTTVAKPIMSTKVDKLYLGLLPLVRHWCALVFATTINSA